MEISREKFSVVALEGELNTTSIGKGGMEGESSSKWQKTEGGGKKVSRSTEGALVVTGFQTGAAHSFVKIGWKILSPDLKFVLGGREQKKMDSAGNSPVYRGKKTAAFTARVEGRSTTLQIRSRSVPRKGGGGCCQRDVRTI